MNPEDKQKNKHVESFTTDWGRTAGSTPRVHQFLKTTEIPWFFCF